VVDKTPKFIILDPMHLSLALLSKKAIDAALKANWHEAVLLNEQILEKNPVNIDAKIRLGRAFIQTRKFEKAKKLFKEVLKVDPINPVALKNLDLAKKCKAETKGQVQIDTRSLLKEPGTTCESCFEIVAKGMTSKDFVSGEYVFLKIKKKSIEVCKCKNDRKIKVGEITDKEMVQKMNNALERNSRISAGFLKGKDKQVTILIKSSIPVFKAEKQDIRPYLKKGSLEEPELEIEEEITVEQ
jgi:tetratricopeptide (TPR) repeat protein